MSKVQVSRRRVLQVAGATATVGVVGGLLSGKQPNGELVGLGTAAAVGRPVPPSLEVIALNRIGFGPRANDLMAFRALAGKTARDKLKTYVERQLEPQSIADAACDAKLRSLDLGTLNKPLEEIWVSNYRGIPESDEARYEKTQLPVWQVRLSMLTRMMHSERPLLERMVEFWHDHFNVHPDKSEEIAVGFGVYHKHLRENALGNFRDLLVGVATSPAMMIYLDNASSNRAGPNENFARELFELHTMGSMNYMGVKRQRDVPGFDKGQPVAYVDDDVYEATRAFTGWRVDNNKEESGLKDSGRFVTYTPWHDRFQKTILGKYLPPDQTPLEDGMAVLEALAVHPGTAKHIAFKLVRRFVGDQPSDGLVQRAAQAFLDHRKDKDQMKHVLRVILLSDEFANTWGEKIKRPLEFVVSSIRALDADWKPTMDFQWVVFWLGQGLFNHAPPDGYADVRGPWLGSGLLLRRWHFVNNVTHNWDKDKAVTDVVGLTPVDKRTPNGVVSYWANRILGRAPSEATRTEMLRMLSKDIQPDALIPQDDLEWRVQSAVALLLMSPEFQWR